MGIFDKVKFWQHDDPLDLDSELPPIDSPMDNAGMDPLPGMEGMQGSMPGQDNMGLGHQPKWDLERNFEPSSPARSPTMPQEIQAGPQGAGMSRDMELISSKLDAIKAGLDSMDQRLRKIESMTEHKADPHAKKDPWNQY